MSHLITDITPIFTRAFPGGKPEMSAKDFDKAKKFVEDRRRNPPPPGPTVPNIHMDYAFWAQTMIVDWRMTVADWERGGKIGPEPAFLICPTCNVMCIFDTMQGDVLMCPGGCHRAITINSFVQLFKPPPRVATPTSLTSSSSPLNSTRRVASKPPGPTTARLDQTVPQGARPEDYGIHEAVKKSRKPLVGWRMWRLDDVDPIRIRSLHIATDSSWEPMTPQRGTCQNADQKDLNHACPSWEHRCGVHAVKEVAQLKKWGLKSGMNRVAGQVEMWGRVLEYEEGYRAEWAYPIKLWLPHGTEQSVADRLWEQYLTEVEIDTFGAGTSIFNQIDH